MRLSLKSSIILSIFTCLCCSVAAPARADSDSTTDPTSDATTSTTAPDTTSAAPSASASGAASALTPDITSLERKFFEHSFPQDSMEDRIERLEKMVFGEAKTGSEQERITALVASVPDPAPQTDPTQTTANNNNNTTPSASPTTADSSATSSEPQITDSSDYPRITELEQEILGKTYLREPVTQRLAQLEKKAFGAPSTSDDLSARTDALDRYASNKFPQTVQTPYSGDSPEMQQSPTNIASSGPAPASNFLHGHEDGILSPTASLDQQVAWLEMRVFGQNYASDSMVSRVKRLQTNIFPGDNNSRHESLPEQVRSLIGAVELSPTPVATQPAENQQYASNAPQTDTAYNQPANANSYYTPPQTQQPAAAPPYNSSPAYNGATAYTTAPAYNSNPAPAYNSNPAPFSAGQYSNPYANPDNTTSFAGTPAYGSGAYGMPSGGGYNTGYTPSPSTYPNNYQQQQTSQASHKGSLLHGLAHVVGTVGGMALRSGMMMGSYGMPGMYY